MHFAGIISIDFFAFGCVKTAKAHRFHHFLLFGWFSGQICFRYNRSIASRRAWTTGTSTATPTGRFISISFSVVWTWSVWVKNKRINSIWLKCGLRLREFARAERTSRFDPYLLLVHGSGFGFGFGFCPFLDYLDLCLYPFLDFAPHRARRHVLHDL